MLLQSGCIIVHPRETAIWRKAYQRRLSRAFRRRPRLGHQHDVVFSQVDEAFRGRHLCLSRFGRFPRNARLRSHKAGSLSAIRHQCLTAPPTPIPIGPVTGMARIVTHGLTASDGFRTIHHYRAQVPPPQRGTEPAPEPKRPPASDRSARPGYVLDKALMAPAHVIANGINDGPAPRPRRCRPAVTVPSAASPPSEKT
jgi:hypothetical protein